MSLSGFLESIIQVINDAGVPYMLTGSLAAAYYAVPRATRDVDVVLDAIDSTGIDRIVEGLLREGYYVDRDAAQEAWRTKGQFNTIDPSRGWKADLIIRKDRPFSVEEFSRRIRASLLGVEISLASLEDVVLAKLEWSQLGDSELQRQDVVRLLDQRLPELDRAYLDRWVDKLGLGDEWKAVLGRLRAKEEDEVG